MYQIPLDEAEQIKHEEAISRLCEEHPAQSDFIRRSYLEILERVSPDATIRTYLTILITKEVKALLRMQELAKSETPLS